MEETLKKLVYAGVGLAAQATERIEETVNDLVKKGKISDKEGKKMSKSFQKTEKKKETYESKFKKAVEDVTEKFNYVKKSDFDKLVKKVASLEKELAGAKKPEEKKEVVSKAKSEVKAAVKG